MLNGLVGLEKRERERTKQADRQPPHLNFIARVQQNHAEHRCAEQVHQWRRHQESAHPAHILPQQFSGSLAELADFESFHSERFHHAVAADCFLEDLAQVGKS